MIPQAAAWQRLRLREVALLATLASTGLDCGPSWRGSSTTPLPAYLAFRNATEDEVRVFVYDADRPRLVGNVQAFHSARLPLPSDLSMKHGRLVYIAAVPVGGRGRDGSPTSGAISRSEAEAIDDVVSVRWTLAGHTLSAEPTRPRAR